MIGCDGPDCALGRNLFLCPRTTSARRRSSLKNQKRSLTALKGRAGVPQSNGFTQLTVYGRLSPIRVFQWILARGKGSIRERAGARDHLAAGTGRTAETASCVSIDRNLPSPGAGAYTRTIAAFGSRDIWRIPDASCRTCPRVAEVDSRREGSNRRRHIHRPRNRSWPVVVFIQACRFGVWRPGNLAHS